MSKRGEALDGRRYGRLTVITLANTLGWQSRYYCRCDCGVEKIIQRSHLLNGHTTSCGCRVRENGKHSIRHGGFSSEGNITHATWRAMKQRCLDSGCGAYQYYGARGITICERWRESFDNFLADMGRRPSSGHSIDRFPDRNGNYEPGNCRWATATEQARNRKNNRFLTFNGDTHLLVEWAALLDIPVSIITTRLSRGWSVERALSSYVSKKKGAGNGAGLQVRARGEGQGC